MAGLSKPVGYECEFIDQVNDEYYCKECQHVAREPHITKCCGETFCKACIQDKKSCPHCRDSQMTSFLQKKYQSKILTLNAHCLMKKRGCKWTGQLQYLNTHVDCAYADVECSKGCGQKVQKLNIESHLSNECSNREYTCPHCSLKATYREVLAHFDVCRYYPLKCPNRCGATFERDELEDHMKMCSLETVKCEFSYVGCKEEFKRNKQQEHMELNIQTHLALIAAATTKQTQTFEKKLEEQEQVFEKKLEEQEQVFEKKLEEQQQFYEQRLKEKDNVTTELIGEQLKRFDQEQIQVKQQTSELNEELQKLQKKLNELRIEFQQQLKQKEESKIQYLTQPLGSLINNLNMVVGIPPYNIRLSGFQAAKQNKNFIESTPMQTHFEGYTFVLRVVPSTTHVSVQVLIMEGKYDKMLSYPRKFFITLNLLDQNRDQYPHSREIYCTIKEKGLYGWQAGCDEKYISLKDIEIYLKRDSLEFEIVSVTF